MVRYEPEGSPSWRTVELRAEGSQYVGYLPCRDVTGGKLKFYAMAIDESGVAVAFVGSRKASLVTEIVLRAPPLALPGKPPPQICSVLEAPEGNRP